VRMEMMMMMELALQVGAWMQIHFQWMQLMHDPDDDDCWFP
jgi:hypothetical protein